jgi:IS30 family transposase
MGMSAPLRRQIAQSRAAAPMPAAKRKPQHPGGHSIMKRTKTIDRPREWTDQERQQLQRLATRGVSVSKIAVALGRHTTSVRRMAREMGLTLRRDTPT